MEKLYTVSKAKTRPGVDCGSDHELIANILLKLKKVGKSSQSKRDLSLRHTQGRDYLMPEEVQSLPVERD